MSKFLFTDGDMFAAMNKSINEHLGIDEIHVEEIEATKPKEETMEWYGMYYDWDELDVRNLKNPVFDNKL